jgi:hypothetical protein
MRRSEETPLVAAKGMNNFIPVAFTFVEQIENAYLNHALP